MHIQNHVNKQWEEEVVLAETETPASYIVKSYNDRLYRRNAVVLRKK